jgi:hypothetical protein
LVVGDVELENGERAWESGCGGLALHIGREMDSSAL